MLNIVFISEVKMVMLLRRTNAVCSCGVNAKMCKHLTAKGAEKGRGGHAGCQLNG